MPPAWLGDNLRYSGDPTVSLFLPFTEAVRVQLYKIASSPKVVHIGMDDSNFSPWNTSSLPSVK